MSMTLTPEQQEAVEAPSPLCIKACAGSGKSTVLVARIAHQIHCGLDPKNIVAITFTRKAANELKEKLRKKGITVGFVGTVHSWALSCLNKIASVPLRAAPDSLFKKMVEDEIKASGADLSFARCLEREWDAIAVGIIKRVRSQLHNSGMIDFDQILTMFEIQHSDLYAGHTALFVDEYQDTGPVERRIYGHFKDLTIVGDERQCLYSFRGADPGSLDEITRAKEMRVIHLSRNFRCEPPIVALADAMLEGEPEPAEPVQVISSRFLELVRSGGDDLVILCGYNATVEVVKNFLTGNGISVAVDRVSQQREKLIAYLTWLCDRYNELTFKHACELCCPEEYKKLEAVAVKELREPLDVFEAKSPGEWFFEQDAAVYSLSHQNDTLSFDELLEIVSAPVPASGQGIKVMTVHAAKGLEWDNVMFCDDLRNTGHHRRMRYVAITRARKQIIHIAIPNENR